MFVVSQEEMKAIEAQAMEQWEMPELLLMEGAARAMVDRMLALDPDLRHRHITVVAGPGNNGGDGLAMARMLYLEGCRVVAFSVAPKGASEAHLLQRRILSHFPVRSFTIENESQTRILKTNLVHADVVIDALFGLGLSRPPEGVFETVIDLINERSLVRYAVDLPSGLHADEGDMGGSVVKASHTFALGFYKRAHFNSKAEPYLGQRHLLPAGFHGKMAEAVAPAMSLLDERCLQQLPKRALDGHKYSYGHLGILGGAVGMSGAAALAIRGAQQSGIGIVSALVDKGVYGGLSIQVPEALVRPTQWEEEAVRAFLAEGDAHLIGPGFSQRKERLEVLRQALASDRPLLIDADGLRLLARMDDAEALLKARTSATVLTPHPGEMAALVGNTTTEVQADREGHAMALARLLNAVVVLKGHHTLIAAPDGRLALNPVDSPLLGTAGSGDVLAGLLAGLLCRMESPFEAACAAVYLHGLAGQRLARAPGPLPLASDIAEAIGALMKPTLLLEETHAG